MLTFKMVQQTDNRQISWQEKLPVHVGLDGHNHRQRCSMFTLSACPFKSILGPLKVLNFALLAVPMHRGVPVGVVRVGNSAMFKSEVVPRMGMQTVQT